MKIVVCGSMTFAKQMVEAEKELQRLGHEVVLPRFTEEYAQMATLEEMHGESAKNKIKHGLIREYFEEIKRGDAILVLSGERHGIKNYVGGNSFLEMAFAHVLDKKIFFLNPIPEMGCKDEMIAMQPIILNGDLSKIYS
jgi:predicted RNA-binding protein with PUA domain